MSMGFDIGDIGQVREIERFVRFEALVEVFSFQCRRAHRDHGDVKFLGEYFDHSTKPRLVPLVFCKRRHQFHISPIIGDFELAGLPRGSAVSDIPASPRRG